jgi:hypothetical protein
VTLMRFISVLLQALEIQDSKQPTVSGMLFLI